LELDELWSFVRHKGNQRWIWFALCKATRQVVACVVGGRGEATCQRLWHALPKNYRQGVVYTDFRRAYRAVLSQAKHQAVGKETGLTNHIERFNNTLRQRLARFVRKTRSFSKSDHLHLICLHAFLVRYNLERAAISRR
jgi:insertion element IS1 protein InsB